MNLVSYCLQFSLRFLTKHSNASEKADKNKMSKIYEFRYLQSVQSNQNAPLRRLTGWQLG